MASFEGNRSPFPAQPSSRFPKLCCYETLFLWNQGVDQLLALLRGMGKFPFASKSALQCTQVEIEEIHAGVNADFVEDIGTQERRDQGRFWKQRRAYEKSLEDPDDVYCSVASREEERKRQGLPPRVGIVPHAAVADEEQRIEAEQARKKRRPRKRPKPTASAKRSVRGKGHD